MSTLTITIDYKNLQVNWEGEINPDTEKILQGLIKYCREHKDSMDLSRELGNIPIAADGNARINLDDTD